MATFMGNDCAEAEIFRITIALEGFGVHEQYVHFALRADAKLSSTTLAIHMAILDAPAETTRMRDACNTLAPP